MVSRPLALAVGALVLTAAACTGAASGDAATSSSEAGGHASTAAPSSAPAPQVSAVEGPCPYLDQDFVESTVGQQIASVIVTTTTPAPGPLPQCEFRRSSGEPAATVQSVTVDAQKGGLAMALELVPGGNPVSAGDGGSVLVKKGESQTQLAAVQGTTMVIVTINQESSLEATEIAARVLSGS